MPATLLLDREMWDFTVDSYGNIALTEGPYALAQDVASAVKLFLGELYYDTLQGVPYWQEVLGKWPPLVLVKYRIVQAALTIPGVVDTPTPVVYITKWEDRVLSGQLQFTDENGQRLAVSF
jgi:hypothetical protein